MKDTREALELRATEGKIQNGKNRKKTLLGVVNTVRSRAFRFGIKGLHYYAHFERGLQ